MTKRVKWGVTAAIFLMIAGMIIYPQIKNQLPASGKDSVVVPAPGTGVRKQVLNINAEVLKFQSLTDKVISTGSIIPDEEVDLSFESSGKVVNIYFSEGTHVKAGDLPATCWPRSTINPYRHSSGSWKPRSRWQKTGYTASAPCWKKMRSARRPTNR